MPWRRSQSRSSKPCEGPRGARTTASALMIAPCGGARPSGRSSCDRLVDGSPSKRPRLGSDSLLERSDARLAGDDDEEASGSADLARGARCDRAHRAARCPTPSASTRTTAPAAAGAGRSTHRDDECDGGRERERDAWPDPHDVREREARDSRSCDDVRRQDPTHGTTSPLRSAMRAGPIPGIASSASTDVNGPCSCAVGRRSSAP